MPYHNRTSPAGDPYSDIRARAEALRNSITDSTSPEEARRIEAEHKRILDEYHDRSVEDLYRRNGLDPASVAHLPIAERKAQWIEQMAQRSEATPMFPHADINASFSNPDFLSRSIGDALYSKMTGRAPEGPAREFANRSLVEIGRALAEASGVRTSMMSRSQVADWMMGAGARMGGMHTTSDFPTLLLGTGQRILSESYIAAQSAIRQLARVRSANDFRSITVARLSEAPRLLEVGEAGEIQHGTRSESKEAFRIRTFARIFGLSRNSIVNDDLDAFGDTARAWGAAAAQVEADELVALFSANAWAGVDLDDGDEWFHTDRGNLAASPAAIDVTSLSLARKAMRDTRGLDNETFLNITPRHLLVGSGRETEAEQVLASLAAVELSEQNPFSGKLSLAVEPRLTGTSWYVFADPSQAPVIECAYLDGAQGPQMATRDGWETLGTEFRCVLDFGCAVTGWRGSYRNPGNS